MWSDSRPPDNRDAGTAKRGDAFVEVVDYDGQVTSRRSRVLFREEKMKLDGAQCEPGTVKLVVGSLKQRSPRIFP